MVDPVVIPTLYFVAGLQIVLTALVVYSALRVTRQTGRFRDWTLIISAFALLTVRNVISLGLTLALPADQLGTLIESIGLTATMLSQMVNVAALVALFLGMFGLAKRFESQSKPP